MPPMSSNTIEIMIGTEQEPNEGLCKIIAKEAESHPGFGMTRVSNSVADVFHFDDQDMLIG